MLCWLLVAGAYTLDVGRVPITEANVPFFAALAALGFFLAAATVLNLLPVPGLDGFGIIHPWLPNSLRNAAARYGSIATFGVYATLWFVQPVRDVFFQLVFQIAAAGHIPVWLVGVGLSDMRLY